MSARRPPDDPTCPPAHVGVERAAVLTAFAPGDELTRPQLVRRVGHVLDAAEAVDHLVALCAMGYIKRTQPHDEAAVYRLTSAGRQARQHFATPGTVAARRELAIPTSSYDGAELRPFTGRAGAMAAFALPSRGISV